MNPLIPDIVLYRKQKSEKETLGEIVCPNTFQTKKIDTLELPWKNNQHDISCIPEGVYEYEKVFDAHLGGNCISVKNVPDRTGIHIHSGNYYTDILGCILPGLGEGDINHDKHLDVIDSKKALFYLLSLIPDKGYLRIINDFE